VPGLASGLTVGQFTDCANAAAATTATDIVSEMRLFIVLKVLFLGELTGVNGSYWELTDDGFCGQW
jgi:hypothetical protein